MGNLIQLKTGEAESDKSGYTNNGIIVEQYTYDPMNRLISSCDSQGLCEYYTNDNFGNVISITTKNGDIIDYEYDVFGNISKLVSKEETILYEYNQLGLISEITDESGVTKYIYDSFGRLTTKQIEPDRKYGDAVSKEVRYTYDNNSNLVRGVAVDRTDNWIWYEEYAYDSLNRVISTGANDKTLYTYDSNGNVLTMKNSHGTTDVSFEYNKAGLKIRQNDAILNKSYQMTYYPDGNMKTYHNGDTITYRYDNCGRLISESKGTEYVKTYTYDNRGNRVGLQFDADFDLGEDYYVWYTYNNKNQLTEERKQIIDQTYFTYYTYDNNGNLYRKVSGNTTDGGCLGDNLGTAMISTDGSEYISEFEFDSLDRMISSKVNNVSSQYVYNGEGLRVFKATGDTRTEYVYDKGNIIAEMDGYSVVNSYQRNLMGIEYDYYNNHYYLDPFGSVVGIRDYDGNTVADAEYDAFGNEISDNSIIDHTPFGYRGEYQDLSSGLIYLRNRYYDPSVGRFITEDPARDGLNWYVYCNNNPIKYIDPSGTVPVETIIDLASIGWSFSDFVSNPSWANFGFLAWDVAATLVPYAPGSYSAKTIKAGTQILSKSDNYVKSGVWAMKAFDRGYEIEKALGGMANNFRVIDKYVRSQARAGIMWLSSVTSIKSVDITAKSYRTASTLKSVLKGYVDDLAGFSKATYKGVTYRLESVGKKTLEIAIPPVEMTSGQAKVFNEIMDYAKEKGIEIITRIVE